ncbi:LADA_0F01662g1_1 [Lachancea dasiensis]|uniref:LADA_0F01662g1_1 n=1 Tax=Lachancea dasiensis TaxID=1072105 RepID=A0A1G4JIJ0_9SACH|nr:LADA_0F01662g1_1 [Lachancea dasiensis]
MYKHHTGSRDEGERYWNDPFYSSNSIDSSDHARNFRNSILPSSISRETSFESGLRLQATNLHEFGGTQTQGADDCPNEYSDLDETETKDLKITASPSLSALSGILSERAKKVGKRNNNSVVNDSIKEEPQDTETAHISSVNESPNLIDIGGSHNNSYPSFDQTPHSTESQEQPDFLTTPKLDPPTPRVEPAVAGFDQKVSVDQEGSASPDLEELSSSVDHAAENRTIHSSKIDAQSSPIITTHPYPKQQAASLRSFSAMSIGSRASVDVVGSEARKRKSIFSFLKRKPQKSSSFVGSNTDVNAVVGTDSLSNETFDNETSELPSSTKLKKKSYSNGSIFSSFRKTKANKKDADDGTLQVPKQRNRVTSQNSRRTTENLGDTPVKRDIRSRKPTPLDFEHRPLESQSQNPQTSEMNFSQDPLAIGEVGHVSSSRDQAKESDTTTDFVKQAPDIPNIDLSSASESARPSSLDEEMEKADSGEVLFPKSLSAQEVESIVSLERSRSVKSNKRNSLNSHRRSLTDNMSTKAQNGGMFITEPLAVRLSTPDLTKSPASSILRNGTFDSLEFSPQKTSSTARSQKGLGITSGTLQAEDKDFSFTSIKQQLNDLTVDTCSEGGDEKNKNLISTPQSENFEKEFMSDIMEFASIIDFDKNLDFNLDLDPADTTYHSLNPSETKYNASQQVDDTSVDSINFGANDSSPKLYSGQEPEHDGLINPQYNHTSQASSELIAAPEQFGNRPNNESPRPYLPTSVNDDDDDDDFEGENFNQLEDATKSNDATNGPSWPSPIMGPGRPLSLSFKGLRGNQLNNPSQISFLKPSPTHYSDSDSLEASRAKTVAFSSNIILYATYTEEEYDRHPDIATCNQLTPQLAQMIKDELNMLKAEMEIHEESRCYTHFY